MGKYHPHGDSSIYEALVVMAQDFKKGQPLVDGHGNFGSIEGDGAAAMRYTEARLQKITQEVYLGDLDKNVVDFVSNFDNLSGLCRKSQKGQLSITVQAFQTPLSGFHTLLLVWLFLKTAPALYFLWLSPDILCQNTNTLLFRFYVL